jgi:Transport and Golgi organisation 2
MCTFVILNRPDHAWPILIAANRDERLDRPWLPPGVHWPERPEVIAGQDELAGGSWLGMNASGVVAGVLNREGTLGPQAGKRSRGELVLDALDYPDAVDAAEALGSLDPRAYRPFNLIVADNRDAFLLLHRGEPTGAPVTVAPLPEGLSMITARELNDERSPRIRLYRPRFLSAAVPTPDNDDWRTWETLLGSRDREPGSGPGGALFIEPDPAVEASNFGTSSSSLIALPAIESAEKQPIWRFASGPPEDWIWQDVARF